MTDLVKVLQDETEVRKVKAIRELRRLAELANSVADLIGSTDEVDAAKELGWWADHSHGIGAAALDAERAMSQALALQRTTSLVKFLPADT
jgi:hypothetical protein